MTIKDMMKLGTTGMSTAQKQEEQERRIKISERINLIHARQIACENEVEKCDKDSSAERMLKDKIRHYDKELARIRSEESDWLKEVAWFMYV